MPRGCSGTGPDAASTSAAALLSHEIAREIEDQLEYPGQVKVTVIRESRAVDVAGNKFEQRRSTLTSEGSGMERVDAA